MLEGGQKPDPRKAGEREAEGQDIKEKVEVAKKEITSLSLGEGQWERSHLTVRRWVSEKHQSWCIPVEDFRNHVATDGSLLGVSEKWSACGWSVVQLDHDEEMGPMRGIHGTLDADLEVQRTFERAELTAFVCLFR